MGLWMVLAGTAALQLYVLRRLRFDGFIVALVLTGTLVSVDYLSYTSISERNYDGSAHLEYIETMAQKLRVPDVYACGPCGHPPLYYALAAFWSKVVLAGNWLPVELGLQWLSLLLFFGFVVFALLIVRSCSARPTTLRLAAALVIFWPSSILNSVRVHNDALASTLMLAAMYFIATWDRHRRNRDFYLALLTSALALLTKSSGYTVAATLILFALLEFRSRGLKREVIKRCALATLVVAGVGATAVGFRESQNPTTLCQKVLGRACDGRYVPVVPDTARRFYSFDTVEFVSRIDTEPGTSFPNRLAKSSLFGVMPLGDELGSQRHETLALVISVLFLAMLIVSAAALPFMRKVRWRKYRVYVAASVIMFAFLIAFRIRLPNEFHEDFRHIFPALVPFCLGYASIVERLGRFSRALHWAGIAIGLSLVASSIVFFLRLP